MTPSKRINLLRRFATAGNRGLTMAESGYSFTATDIADLDGMVVRLPGNGGVYQITQAGQAYLAVREQGAAA